MSDNNIQIIEDGEPPEQQLRSEEAKRYRLERNELRNENAALIQDAVAREERLQATQRQLIDHQLRSKFQDAQDFWGATKLEDLRADDGTVDLDVVKQHADSLLEQHPHWRTRSGPDPALVSRGLIGHGPRNMLDTDNVRPESGTDWGSFLSGASQQ